MKTLRNKVFETNSSACHCVTLIKKEELQKAFEDQYNYVFRLPDTGEYCTDDKYELMTLTEAFNFWNSHVDEYNERYKNINFHVEKFEQEYQFKNELDSGHLSQDEIFGKFLNYQQLMAHIPPAADGNLDVMWWNYD